jgi:hypothetical protein
MEKLAMKMKTKYIHFLFAVMALVGGCIYLSAQTTSLEEVADTRARASSAVDCYFIGRAYLNATGQGQVAGYFTSIKGLSGPLFSGSPSEATAFFTFRSDVFSLTPLPPNGEVGLDLVSAGTFSIYYNPNPNGAWSDPDTFSDGQLVAKFSRDETLFLQIGPLSKHVLNETLLASQNFAFNNRTYNFNRLTPGGIILDESFNNTPLQGTTDFPVSLAFAGNGVSILSKE